MAFTHATQKGLNMRLERVFGRLNEGLNGSTYDSISHDEQDENQDDNSNFLQLL